MREVKQIACCHKWKDIGSHEYQITFAGETHDTNEEQILFDKRRVRFCPECGKPLYTYWELFKRIFK